MENNQQTKKKDYLLPISIVLAALIIGGAFIYSKGVNVVQKAEVEQEQQSTGNTLKLTIASDNVVLGKDNAPITIFEFADYQCPYCRRFYLLTHISLVKDYVDTGLAKIVFIDVPLPFHEFAQKASEAAWCAKDQNKFWEMHDKIFATAENAEDLKIESLVKYGKELGLDTQLLSDCLNSNKYAARVQESLNLASKLGILGTPSMIITPTKNLPLDVDIQKINAAFQGSNPQVDLGNAVLLIGAQPYSVVKSVLDVYAK